MAERELTIIAATADGLKKTVECSLHSPPFARGYQGRTFWQAIQVGPHLIFSRPSADIPRLNFGTICFEVEK